MCDDINGIAHCGIDSVALNSFINTQIELKKLRFHVVDRKVKSKYNSFVSLILRFRNLFLNDKIILASNN